MVSTSHGRGRAALFMLGVTMGAALGTSALAQSADPLAPKPSVVRALAADMADSLADPRISQSQAAGLGIWKWVVPPVKMNGAFDDHDPIGLAAGKLIPADCSINWTDPDTRRLYCFTSGTSLVYFLTAPHTYTARATRGWLRHLGS